MRRLISPTSSRNTVPPCAWRSRPGLSRYAPVKLPRAWPKNSDSSSESGTPAQLIVMNGGAGAVAALMDRPRDDFFAHAGFAGEQTLAPVRAAESISA